MTVALSADNKNLLMPRWNLLSEWDLDFPKQPHTIVATDLFNYTHFPRFAPDGQSMYIGGFGAGGHYSLTNSAQNPLKRYALPLRVFDVSPDGRYLASAVENADAGDFNIYWIDTQTGRTERRFTGFTRDVNFIDISADGKLLTSGSFDLTARVWDTQTGKTLQIFKGHTGVVASSSFSPDATRIVTSSSDMTVRVWDVASSETILTIEVGEPVPHAVFSPDGTLIATSGTDNRAHLYDAITGEEHFAFIGHEGSVWTINFSPDGKLVASASFDGTVRVWDTQTGTLVRVFHEPNGNEFYWAEFSPDGKSVLAGGGQSDQVYIWWVDFEDVISEICSRPMVDLTPEERQQYGITDDAPTCPQVGG